MLPKCGCNTSFAPLFEQTLLPAPFDNRVEQTFLSIRFGKPLPEARQDGKVEAGIIVLEPQQIPERNAVSHGIRHFPVGQTLGVLHDQYECQSPRRCGRLTNLREEVGKHLIGKDRPQFIAEREVAVAFGKSRVGSSGGHLRYGWNRLRF